MQNIFKTLLSTIRLPCTQISNFHAVSNAPLVAATDLTSTPWSFSSIRTNIRNHFPKPIEVKRYKKHSYFFRLRTTNGKKIIMRRILKGRHELSPGW